MASPNRLVKQPFPITLYGQATEIEVIAMPKHKKMTPKQKSACYATEGFKREPKKPKK
jgi:hypothetical protein